LPAGQRVLTGILNYSFGVYELQPTIAIVPSSWTASDPRPGAPVVSGRLKVATMNVLNFFPTLDTSTAAACASNANCCGPDGTQECRGAQTASELTRQEAKMQAAMKAVNADVYALQELENPALTGPRAAELALTRITTLLNTSPNAPGTYAYVATGSIGGDAIKVGLIYRVSKLALAGGYQVIDNADCATYHDNRNRPSLAQTFRELATGAKFTALVAHLKSKGSSCSSDGDPLDVNGQGECNLARLAAAQCIRSWLAGDPTGSADADFLLLGDMNAYARENPITYLESNGYVDLMRQSQFDGVGAYDYVFEGEGGALSHVISSTALFGQVSGAATWHINADEPRAFDYNDFNQAAAYAANEFRAADHDPIIVGLNLTVPPTGPAVPASDWRWLSLLSLALTAMGLYATRCGTSRLRAELPAQ
jgi:predicted extracellular nuclease